MSNQPLTTPLAIVPDAPAGAASSGARAGGFGSSERGGVLLLTAGVGGGHVRAAEAVATALRDGVAARRLSASVRVVDLLEVSPRMVGMICRDAYVALVQRSPRLVGWLYQRFDRPDASGLRGRFLWSAFGSARRLIASSGAEAIVSTHFLASELVVRMRRAGELDPATPLETVVTDVDAHGLWIQPGTDRYFVAGATGAATLVRAGVSAARIVESGIPIDPAFERLPPRSWARRILGLDHDRPVVLYSTGGAFVGPVERSVRALSSVRSPAQIVVICGRAERARQRLLRAARSVPLQPGVSLRIEGFTDRMHVWMAAADLFVGKPGGLTSAECRAASLPMVISSAIPGQEERNADDATRLGVAVRVSRIDAIPAVVDALLDDRTAKRHREEPDSESGPELGPGGMPTLETMRRAAAVSASPASARRVADAVIERLVRRSLAARLADAPPAPPASRRAG